MGMDQQRLPALPPLLLGLILAISGTGAGSLRVVRDSVPQSQAQISSGAHRRTTSPSRFATVAGVSLAARHVTGTIT